MSCRWRVSSRLANPIGVAPSLSLLEERIVELGKEQHVKVLVLWRGEAVQWVVEEVRIEMLVHPSCEVSMIHAVVSVVNRAITEQTLGDSSLFPYYRRAYCAV